MLRTKPIISFAAGVFFLALVARASVPDAGWLCDDFRLTLAPGHRTEIAGPFFYSEENESQTQRAMPPLWSDTFDPVTDYHEFDFLYPLLTYDRFGTQRRFQIFQLYSIAGGEDQNSNDAKRFTIFPIYFRQRSPDTNLNYTALFPIYGELKNRLFKDDIKFAAFPVYAKTQKRDIVTKNYLFPFFHVRTGDGLKGWQAWPVAGHEKKVLTYKTNLFDTVEPDGGHDNWFALWPFYFNSHTGIGTTNEAHELDLIPAYTQYRSPLRDSTTWLWPFFTFTNDREKKFREWDAPWPLIVFARGEGKTVNRVWPLFGRAHSAIQESDFYFWPIYQFHRLHSDPLDRTRTRIFFFLYSDLFQKNTETGKYLRRVDFFPFFTYHRDYNGDSRLQVLAPVEPFLPNNKSIERNYSPLWSLWRAEKNGTTGAASESLLWNLYRHDNFPDQEKYSLALGLFRYQSAGNGAQWHLFYLPFGKAAPPLPAPVFAPVPEMTTTNNLPRLEHPHYDEATNLK